MKSLENKAKKYDKGIKTLTLGRYPKIKQFIVKNYLTEGESLLDLGMGTGTFAILATKKGVTVTGIDYSEKMLNIAKKNIEKEKLSDLINIRMMPITNLDQVFSDNSFDKITAMLFFSELYQKEQDYSLDQIHRILKEGGQFILVDEVKPKKLWKKIIYFIIRTPLVIFTFFKSQLTTKPLKDIEKRLEKHHFKVIEEKLYLLDSLKLLRLKKS